MTAAQDRSAKARRAYRQYCGVARALDVVGERWTLLLVRELLTGPKRYTDLLEALRGIGTNLLADRLKDLETAGVIKRATLPPPAGSTVYGLTERGQALEPVVLALAAWGSVLLGVPEDGEYFRPGWAVLAMKTVFQPQLARGLRETYEFRVGDEVFHFQVDDGAAEARQGSGWRPAFVLRTNPDPFLALAVGRLTASEALAQGLAQFEGDLAAFERCGRIFPPVTMGRGSGSGGDGEFDRE
ncbi:MAG TPA: winged helix-turn-helix transcriptional regulator [Chloroflexota bacterium]|nr:winged helix-turn-helix transcriptional regulator [Chloroflexota bacterium]